MAFTHGKDTKVWVATYDLTPYLTGSTVAEMTETGETTGYGADDKTYVVGLSDATIDLEGLFNTASNIGSDPALHALRDDTDQIATIQTGNRTKTGQAVATALTTSSVFDDVTRMSYSLQVSDHHGDQEAPLLSGGRVLYDGTTGSNTQNGSTVDFGAHTGGVIAVYHSIEPSANLSIRVDTSASSGFGSSATLVASVTVSGSTTNGRLAHSSTAAQRYVRIRISASSSGHRVFAALYKV